jgi:hypothetical protein
MLTVAVVIGVRGFLGCIAGVENRCFGALAGA